MGNCNINNQDTVCLLKEVNAGCKMATNSMEQVLPYVKDENLKRLIHNYNASHVDIGDECHTMLNDKGDDEKDPHKMASAMSWFSVEMKLLMGADNAKIAGMLMDGCNMGIQSVSKYINQYSSASKESVNLADRLIKDEEKFMLSLKEYL